MTLIERLEAARAPDRELDAEIMAQTFKTITTDDDLIYAHLRAKDGSDATHPGHYFIKTRSGASCITAPELTSSPDAAVALLVRVLPDWFIDSLSDVRQRIVYKGDQHTSTGKFEAKLQHIHGGRLKVGIGASFALALCIAILKAKLAEEKKDD